MSEHAPSSHSLNAKTVPLWMRKGTVWTILMLTTALFALIAYYLLPLWWARLVNYWVGASNSWVTGIVLGFTLFIITLASIRGVWVLVGMRKAKQTRGISFLLPTLAVIAGLSLAMILLTIFIALGLTEPLVHARALWQEHAPSVMSATLVGALLAVIAILGAAQVFSKLKRKKLDDAFPFGGQDSDQEHGNG